MTSDFLAAKMAMPSTSRSRVWPNVVWGAATTTSFRVVWSRRVSSKLKPSAGSVTVTLNGK